MSHGIDALLVGECTWIVRRHLRAHVDEEFGNRLARPFAQEGRSRNRGRWWQVWLSGAIQVRAVTLGARTRIKFRACLSDWTLGKVTRLRARAVSVR